MKRIGLLWVFTILGGFSLAWGDATIETTTSTGGIKGMGASEGAVTRRFQGGKMWESTSTKFTGAILSRVAGGSEGIVITRIDKGIYWNLDPKKRTYTENPIEPFKKELGREKEPQEKPKVRVTQSEFTVKKTGASETIHGFPCEEYVVNWLLELENLETKEKSKSTMVTNLWTTPETVGIRKAQEEERAFHKAYAQKIGLQISPEESKQLGMTALTTLSGAPPEEIEKGFLRVKEEMSKIKGYTIRSVVKWSWEGDKAKASSSPEGSSSESPSGLTGGVGKLIGGLMGGMMQKKGEEKTPPAGEKGGPFFSSTTEVKSINTEAISPATFEVPAGFEKK